MTVWIQQAINGELFSIYAAEPYPADYEECLDRAAEERRRIYDRLRETGY